MGPGFFPTVLGFLLAGLGIIITLLSFVRTGDPLPEFVWRPLVILVVAICLYGILFPTAGFVLATIVLIVVGSRADPDLRWLESLVLGVLLAIFSTTLFFTTGWDSSASGRTCEAPSGHT